LSQEDIEIFLENESLKAAQTCSQEVRSHHVPHIDQVFDTHEASFEFYNTYSDIIGFSAKIAGNYHCRNNNKATRYTFKCNRYGKVLDEETKAERKRKRDLKRQETRRKKMQEKGETEPLKPSPPPGIPPKDQPKKRKRNNVEITGCLAEMIVTLKGDKWVITSLNMEHNHELSPPEESRFLRSHKHMTNEEKLFIRTFNSVKLRLEKSWQY
jgi:hypothetical protein